MGQSYLARIDETLAKEIIIIKEKLGTIGLYDITDRQASQIVAAIIKEYNFSLEKKCNKRKTKIILDLK